MDKKIFNEIISDLKRLYYNKHIDIDFSTYWTLKDEVEYFTNENEEILNLFKLYKSKIKQTYYILGNRFLFIYNGVKYCYSLSSSDDEYQYVDEVIDKLYTIDGVSEVMYCPGKID